MSRILVVDDEPAICWGLSRLAHALGHRVDTASSAEEGLAIAAAARPDLLVLDVRLPGMDGLTAMRSFRLHMAARPIIVMTAFGELATAISAVENGAFEYLVKPFDLAEVRAAIERALRGGEPDEPPHSEAPAVGGMLGSTPVMHAMFKRIALAAASDVAVLLTGEAGVGKELAARAIHRHSARRDSPFVVVNIAGLDPDAAEAELFGASGLPGGPPPRKGLVAQADGGTVFLDEVAELPLCLQAKLLRTLEHGEVRPVGTEQPVRSSVRVISATQRDLRSEITGGTFRHDLFSHLSAFPIAVAPLRRRTDDIPTLVRHFASQFGPQSAIFAQETLLEMQGRPWYGNVRELKNAVDHALTVARSGAVLPMHLPEPLPPLDSPAASPTETPVLRQAVSALASSLLENPQNAGGVYDRFLEQVEPPLLAAVLKSNGNRCAPAARALGLHRTTLKRKLDQYGIDEAPGG